MSGCTHEWSKGKLNCPYCEIDRLNKEINRLRQYEDAITSAIDGTLLVWNLISTNHTVIKNDYWQNHLEEIDRLKAELEEANAEKRRLLRLLQMIQAGEMLVHTENLERQLAEARVEINRRDEFCGKCENGQLVALEQARQDVAREILQIISMETIDRPFEQSQAVEIIRQRYGLEG